MHMHTVTIGTHVASLTYGHVVRRSDLGSILRVAVKLARFTRMTNFYWRTFGDGTPRSWSVCQGQDD
jgi:hypothetical protein